MGNKKAVRQENRVCGINGRMEELRKQTNNERKKKFRKEIIED